MSSKVIAYNKIDEECIRCDDKLATIEKAKYSKIFYSPDDEKKKVSKLNFKISSAVVKVKDTGVDLILSTGEKNKTLFMKIVDIDNRIVNVARKKVSRSKWFTDSDISEDDLNDMFKPSIKADTEGKVMKLIIDDYTKIIDKNKSDLEIDMVKDKTLKCSIVIELDKLKFKKTSFMIVYKVKKIKFNEEIVKVDEDSDYDDKDLNNDYVDDVMSEADSE